MQISITVEENGLIFLDYKWNLLSSHYELTFQRHRAILSASIL